MFESTAPYSPERIHAAAMYCSDGRMGEHFDNFLTVGLSLPRYDRVILPGGPACLAGYPEMIVNEESVVDELKFLIDAHQLRRVVLVQHQNCAFYTSRLGLSEPRLELVQRADLVRAAAYISRVVKLDQVEGYFARIDNGRVRFEPVAV